MRVDVDVYVSGVRWNEQREEKGRGGTNQKGTEGVPRWRPPSCRPRDGDMGSAYPGVNLIFLRKSTTESDVGPRIYPGNTRNTRAFWFSGLPLLVDIRLNEGGLAFFFRHQLAVEGFGMG